MSSHQPEQDISLSKDQAAPWISPMSSMDFDEQGEASQRMSSISSHLGYSQLNHDRPTQLQSLQCNLRQSASLISPKQSIQDSPGASPRKGSLFYKRVIDTRPHNHRIDESDVITRRHIDRRILASKKFPVGTSMEQRQQSSSQEE
ncbi:hypothetical protein LMH87_011948 [Akanthomyces muscarius]|uniref:Uncharacterized protein n=1 Tax=Akanthomyces muscarius TaxID=2231603 RepID=A0A9W8ULN1_AKAMU|nr:hypothetical protein LMH87_011948 [Akanthomyces muscarius]KAJ4151235.1 hypothetical protein LMH87_011948 [Akanthomyces muscarius]